MNPKNKFEVQYDLGEAAGSLFTAPMLLPIGATFEHEYGTYEVTDITYNPVNVTLKAVCSKIKSDRELYKTYLPKL